MPYVENRIVHDADSHLMELPDCLDAYFDPKRKADYHALPSFQHKLGKAGWADQARARQRDETFRGDGDSNILLRKNYEAMGAFERSDRPHALDLLGFASQLVFTTFCLGNFGLDQGKDADLAYAAAQAHNRMMTDFCSVDRRFLPTGYVPLMDRARAPAAAKEAIELGASWVPGWMRFMDSAHGAFIKNEERLQKLSMRPSEFVRRQFRVTPYPHEDTAWIVANAGEEVALFSSDYPHVEGGRNPLKRFNDSLAETSPRAVDRFYRENFIDLMGEGLAADLRRPAHLVAA